MIPNPFPWVEIVDPKPEPSFTLDQIIEKMVKVFGENLANPEHYPAIAKYQFNTAKYLCGLSSTKEVGTPLVRNFTQLSQ